MDNVDGFLSRLAKELLGEETALVYWERDETSDSGTRWHLKVSNDSTGIGINFKAAKASIRQLARTKKALGKKKVKTEN